MTRHGLHPTAAAHHAFWATERRVLARRRIRMIANEQLLFAINQMAELITIRFALGPSPEAIQLDKYQAHPFEIGVDIGSVVRGRLIAKRNYSPGERQFLDLCRSFSQHGVEPFEERLRRRSRHKIIHRNAHRIRTAMHREFLQAQVCGSCCQCRWDQVLNLGYVRCTWSARAP